MKFFLPVLLLAAAAANTPAVQPSLILRSAAWHASQTVRLDPGEFRWLPIPVARELVRIDCRYEVLKGAGTVHAELVPQSELKSFVRHRTYAPIAATGTAMDGSFTRIVQGGGDYALIIVNQERAPAALVFMAVQTSDPARAQTLPAGRKIIVVLTSLAIFFVSAGWSGQRLIRGIQKGRR
jgi:hypothetical protein